MRRTLDAEQLLLASSDPVRDPPRRGSTNDRSGACGLHYPVPYPLALEEEGRHHDDCYGCGSDRQGVESWLYSERKPREEAGTHSADDRIEPHPPPQLM